MLIAFLINDALAQSPTLDGYWFGMGEEGVELNEDLLSQFSNPDVGRRRIKLNCETFALALWPEKTEAASRFIVRDRMGRVYMSGVSEFVEVQEQVFAWKCKSLDSDDISSWPKDILVTLMDDGTLIVDGWFGTKQRLKRAAESGDMEGAINSICGRYTFAEAETLDEWKVHIWGDPKFLQETKDLIVDARMDVDGRKITLSGVANADPKTFEFVIEGPGFVIDHGSVIYAMSTEGGKKGPFLIVVDDGEFLRVEIPSTLPLFFERETSARDN